MHSAIAERLYGLQIPLCSLLNLLVHGELGIKVDWANDEWQKMACGWASLDGFICSFYIGLIHNVNEKFPQKKAILWFPLKHW